MEYRDGGRTTNAQGSFGLGQFSGILARRKDSSVGLKRRDSQVMEYRDGGRTTDAQGSFGLGQFSGILARREDGSIGLKR